MPMHTFGHPAKMDQLLSIAKEFNLKIVEDAAESIGSFYKGKHTGLFGDMGVISFNGNKTITTGGGGMILTNNKALAVSARHLSTTAKEVHSWKFSHDQIGYNYRMPNINAAIGCAQLEKLPEFLSKKRRLFDLYNKEFKDIEGVFLFNEPKNCSSNYWLQTLVLNESNKIGIGTRPVWQLISSLNPYIKCPKSATPNAEILEKSIINIPSSVFLIK